MHVKMLDHLNMTVSSLPRTVDWYARVFGFELVEEGSHRGRPWGIIRSADAMLCIYEDPDRGSPELSEHASHGVAHFGLRIDDRPSWEATVARESVEVLYDGPVRWAHSTSWYVEDPNGYEIEVALWHHGRPHFGDEAP